MCKRSNSDMSICVFARALEKDILIAKEVTKNLKMQNSNCVPCFNLQIKYSVNANKEQIIMQLKESILLAKNFLRKFSLQRKMLQELILPFKKLLTLQSNMGHHHYVFQILQFFYS